MLSGKAAAMAAGMVIAQFCSGWFPASQAAWAWQCTVYKDGSITGATYLDAEAQDGITCADGSTLTCPCTGSPCKNRAHAAPSSLICAGAGDDAATSGCYKLHHTYGTPPGFKVWAGRSASGDQIKDACGEADVIKAYTTEQGAGIFENRGGFTKDQMDTTDHGIDSAQACQAKCASTPDCKFFTYNDQGAPDGKYKPFKACVLQKELACSGTAYSTFHGAISGPSTCPDGVTVPPAGAPAPAPEPAPEPAPGPAPEPGPSPSPSTTKAAEAAASSANNALKATLALGAILSAVVF